MDCVGSGVAGVCAYCAMLIDEPVLCPCCLSDDVKYCGEECRQAAWPAHKVKCAGHYGVGDAVTLHGLKSAQFNDLPGTVVGPIANSRYPVEVSADGKTSKLLVKVENIKVRKLDFDVDA